jgi:hypothetical protein
MTMPAALKRSIAIAALFAASNLSAQSVDTVVIDFTLTGPQCKVPDLVWVVLKDEGARFEAKRDDSGSWVGTWPREKLHETFSIAHARASLRLNGARTECQNAKPAKKPKNPDTYVAAFTFKCNVKPVQQVRISTTPATFPLGYVRTLVQSQGGDCVESAYFEEGGPIPVDDVRRDSEQLRLQLGWSKEDPEAPLGLALFNPPFKHHAGRAAQGISRNEVLQILDEQRAMGDGSGPNFSSNDRTINEERTRRLQTLTLTVK